MSTLTNEQFRALLATPREPKKVEISEKEKAKNEKKKLYARKAQKLKEKEEVKPKYRDRAEERRRNENPDYKENEDEQLLTGFHQVAGPNADQRDPEERKAAVREMIEKSKYLGGDMEHTHLVKGLDKALLEKIRAEPEPKRIGAAEDEDEKDGSSVAPELTPFVKKERRRQEARAKRNAEEQDRVLRKEKASAAAEWGRTGDMAFVTPLGRAVHYTLFGRELPKTTQAFLPGRMAFTFDLESNEEIPTTLIRSKDECPAHKESVRDRLEQDLMDRLSSIMSYVRGGSKKKKKGKSGEGQAGGSGAGARSAEPMPPPKPKPKNPDDDIFGDVGSDYVPEVRTDRRRDQPQQGAGYFGGRGDDAMDYQASLNLGADLKSVEHLVNKPVSQVRQETADPFMQPYIDPYYQYDPYGIPYPYSAAAAAAGQDPYKAPRPPGSEPAAATGERATKPKRKIDEREKDPNFVGDEYAECYPGTYEMAFEAYEGSDDEADLSKMDVNKKMRLRRWDFDTEEAWSSYNEKREAMPKAAFQFGVKTADGRKTRKSKEDKLSRDLKKINAMIKDRENLGTSTSATAQEMVKRKKNDHSGDYD